MQIGLALMSIVPLEQLTNSDQLAANAAAFSRVMSGCCVTSVDCPLEIVIARFTLSLSTWLTAVESGNEKGAIEELSIDLNHIRLISGKAQVKSPMSKNTCKSATLM